MDDSKLLLKKACNGFEIGDLATIRMDLSVWLQTKEYSDLELRDLFETRKNIKPSGTFIVINTKNVYMLLSVTLLTTNSLSHPIVFVVRFLVVETSQVCFFFMKSYEHLVETFTRTFAKISL